LSTLVVKLVVKGKRPIQRRLKAYILKLGRQSLAAGGRWRKKILSSHRNSRQCA